jgi:hypothetical protein
LGFGRAKQVWVAICKPYDEKVAIKRIELEKLTSNLVSVIRKKRALDQTSRVSAGTCSTERLDSTTALIPLDFILMIAK